MTRADKIDQLRSREPWDILVIGGGATGLGSAVDAASRGYRTLLIEAHDFAQATSSRSTKLIHGGVRYLAQGNLGLVREALHERGVLLRNAPHLVHELAFVVPCRSRWSLAYYGLGLKAYDWLSGSQSIGRSRRLGRDETVRLLPTILGDSLAGGILYRDGQFDDARMAVALAGTAEREGAVVVNYVQATGFRHRLDRVVGVLARDAETGETFEIEAKAIINATGVFADEVRRLEDPSAKPAVRPSQGSHIVLDRSFLPGETALMIPKTDDGRVLFAIPWLGRVLVGTTDAPVERPEIEPTPRAEEVEFLLSHLGRYLAKRPDRSDARSVFAGLRPLLAASGGRATSRLSREHAVLVSRAGLITITGGKWTTYRRMAADALAKAVERADLPRRLCVTDSLHLKGWTDRPDSGFAARYGADAECLRKLSSERPEWSEPIHLALPYLKAEVIWGARHESARTVEDVLARRTRALMLDARAASEAAPAVADLMAEQLGRDDAWKVRQVREFRELAGRWM